MEPQQLKEIVDILPKGRTLFRYFKDRYAFLLLARAAVGEADAGTTSVSKLKRSPFARLLAKPAVQQWLAKQGNDIAIVNTSNAGNPLTSNYQPLMTVDIWEHAYYIDYRNARAKYLDIFCSLINWKFVEGNFKMDKVSIEGVAKM